MVSNGLYWLIMVRLVVEPNPSEKYDLASWNDDIPNMMGKS